MLRNAFTPPCGFDLASTTVATAPGLAAISYWGYRLVLHPDGSNFVHETYYDAQEGLLGIARDPARPCGDTTAEVRDALAWMEEGLAEPALRFLDYVPAAGAAGDGASGEPAL